jgi:hypothetical protein
VVSLYKKFLLLILCFIFLFGCSSQSTISEEDLSQPLVAESIIIVSDIENRYKEGKALSVEDHDKIDEFVYKYDPVSKYSELTDKEKDFVMKIVELANAHFNYVYMKDITKKEKYLDLLNEVKSTLKIE